jgi:hypothetical protein
MLDTLPKGEFPVHTSIVVYRRSATPSSLYWPRRGRTAKGWAWHSGQERRRVSEPATGSLKPSFGNRSLGIAFPVLAFRRGSPKSMATGCPEFFELQGVNSEGVDRSTRTNAGLQTYALFEPPAR